MKVYQATTRYGDIKYISTDWTRARNWFDNVFYFYTNFKVSRHVIPKDSVVHGRIIGKHIKQGPELPKYK